MHASLDISSHYLENIELTTELYIKEVEILLEKSIENDESYLLIETYVSLSDVSILSGYS